MASHTLGAAARPPLATLLLIIVALPTAGLRPVGAQPPSSRSDPPRLAIAYLLRDTNGTTGVGDPIDRQNVLRIGDVDGALLYVRLGEEMWVSRDDSTIAEIRQVLATQDLAEMRLRQAHGGRGFEQERREIDRRRRELNTRQRELDVRRAALRAEIDRTRKQGEVPRLRMSELAALDNQIQGLRSVERDIDRSDQMLAARMEAAYRENATTRAERERIQRRTLEAIVRITRRAVRDGRATPCEP